MNTQTNDPVFRKYEELLTPYLQGKLGADDVQALEDYADSSPAFRDMLQFEKQLVGGIRAAGAVDTNPSFAVLRERIKQERGNPLQRILEMLSGGMRSLIVPALLASAIAAVVVVQFISVQEDDILDSKYSTLSSEETAAVRAADRSYYQLALNDAPAAGVLESMSRELGFRVEGGPDSIGIYEISRPRSGDMPDLSVLKNDSRVLLLEPIPQETSVP